MSNENYESKFIILQKKGRMLILSVACLNLGCNYHCHDKCARMVSTHQFFPFPFAMSSGLARLFY